MGEKTPKNPLLHCKKEETEFHCEICNYTTNRCSNYKKHIKTDKHFVVLLDTNGVKNVQNVPKKPIEKVSKSSIPPIFYECKKCNYSTIYKTNYNKHLKTTKHKVAVLKIQKNTKTPKNPKSSNESSNENSSKKQYFCRCCDFSTHNKKDYDRHETTNKHKKNVENHLVFEKQNNELITNMVVEIMKQNTDMFKTIITDQTQKILEVQNNNAINHQCITNTNTNTNSNNNNNNNNRFNINFFLHLFTFKTPIIYKSIFINNYL
jgi:hypothetical protein